MKQACFALLLAAAASSCGKDANNQVCADSPLADKQNNGNWQDVLTGTTIYFGKNCDGRRVNTTLVPVAAVTCDNRFTFAPAAEKSGTVALNIYMAQGSDCWNGSVNCTYSISGQGSGMTMTLNCGSGNVIFTKY